jgi:hypothetical protein
MFIWNSRHDVRIPLDRVQYVRASAWPDKSTVILGEDEEYIVDDRAIEDALSAPVAVIPAAAGYFIVHEDVESGPEQFTLTPVIAWSITRYNDVQPLTVAGLNDKMYRPMPVVKPCGSVWEPSGEQEFPDVASYLRYCVRQREARFTNKGQADG